MKNYETGDVTCSRCGEYLGNYMTDDYFRMIRLEYCPHCREAAKRETKRLWARDRRAKQKQYNKALLEKIKLLEQENEALRQQVKEKRNKDE